MEFSLSECWPNRLQELLLRATVLEGDAARSAWDSWRSEVDIETIDIGSQRLLPETYTNLMRMGVVDPLMGRMKGVKRRTWLENQLLFHQATAAIQILQDRGMETMITKGPALAMRHYRDVGRRPMADFDIVVRKNRARDAVEALEENGFTPMEPGGGAAGLSGIHAVSYYNETGRQFDLHWQVIAGCTDDRLFWDDAEPITIENVTTLTPSPTDLLFHVCIHGLRSNLVPPLRWVVDASILMRDAEIDWDRLLHLSKRFWLQRRMREALQYLTRFDIEIPSRVLSGLSRQPRRILQHWEFELVTGKRLTSFQTQMAVLWLGFKRHSEAGPLRWTQFPGYLKRVWKAESVWTLPRLIVFKGTRRLFANTPD